MAFDPYSTEPVEPQDEPKKQPDLDSWDRIVAKETGVPHSLLKSMAKQESSGSGDTKAVSPTNVKGRYQVTQDVAKSFGLNRDDPYEQSVAAAKYLKQHYDALKDIKDDRSRWLGAVGRYYAGEGAVQGNKISGQSVDKLSNPVAHLDHVARNWAEYEKNNPDDTLDSSAPSTSPKPKTKPLPRGNYTPGQSQSRQTMAEQEDAALEAYQAKKPVQAPVSPSQKRINANLPAWTQKPNDPRETARLEAEQAQRMKQNYEQKGPVAQFGTNVLAGVKREGGKTAQLGANLVKAVEGGADALGLPPSNIAQKLQEGIDTRNQELAQFDQAAPDWVSSTIRGGASGATAMGRLGLAGVAGGLPGIVGVTAGSADWRRPKSAAIETAVSAIPVGGALLTGAALPAKSLLGRIGVGALGGAMGGAGADVAAKTLEGQAVTPFDLSQNVVLGAGQGAFFPGPKAKELATVPGTSRASAKLAQNEGAQQTRGAMEGLGILENQQATYNDPIYKQGQMIVEGKTKTPEYIALERQNMEQTGIANSKDMYREALQSVRTNPKPPQPRQWPGGRAQAPMMVEPEPVQVPPENISMPAAQDASVVPQGRLSPESRLAVEGNREASIGKINELFDRRQQRGQSPTGAERRGSTPEVEANRQYSIGKINELFTPKPQNGKLNGGSNGKLRAVEAQEPLPVPPENISVPVGSSDIAVSESPVAPEIQPASILSEQGATPERSGTALEQWQTVPDNIRQAVRQSRNNPINFPLERQAQAIQDAARLWDQVQAERGKPVSTQQAMAPRGEGETAAAPGEVIRQTVEQAKTERPQSSKPTSAEIINMPTRESQVTRRLRDLGYSDKQIKAINETGGAADILARNQRRGGGIERDIQPVDAPELEPLQGPRSGEFTPQTPPTEAAQPEQAKTYQKAPAHQKRSFNPVEGSEFESLGQVTIAENQLGVPADRVRVIADKDGTVHVIPRKVQGTGTRPKQVLRPQGEGTGGGIAREMNAAFQKAESPLRQDFLEKLPSIDEQGNPIKDASSRLRASITEFVKRTTGEDLDSMSHLNQRPEVWKAWAKENGIPEFHLPESVGGTLRKPTVEAGGGDVARNVGTQDRSVSLKPTDKGQYRLDVRNSTGGGLGDVLTAAEARKIADVIDKSTKGGTKLTEGQAGRLLGNVNRAMQEIRNARPQGKPAEVGLKRGTVLERTTAKGEKVQAMLPSDVVKGGELPDMVWQKANGDKVRFGNRLSIDDARVVSEAKLDSSPIDPKGTQKGHGQMFNDMGEAANRAIDNARRYVGENAMKFTEFAKQMLSDFGEKIRPHLVKLYADTKQFVKSEVGSAATAPGPSKSGRSALQGQLAAKYRKSSTKNADGEKPSLSQKASTALSVAQMMSGKFAIRNVAGNSAQAAIRNAANAVATIPDLAASLITGKRSITMPKVKPQVQGALEGMVKEFNAVWKGGQQTESGKVYGLDKQAFESKVGRFTENVLKTINGVPDEAFYLAAYRESVANQLSAATKSRKAKAPNLNEIHDQAKLEAAQATFRDDNVVSSFLGSLKKGINKLTGNENFGVADFIGLRYPRVPGAIVARAVEYSPANFARTLYELAKPLTGRQFDQRAFSQSIGKAVVGSGAGMGMGYMLQKMGIIAPSEKDKNKRGIRNVERQAGISDYQINMSALKRWTIDGGLLKLAGGEKISDMSGMRPGDRLASYDWAQPVAISWAMGAAVADRQGKEKITGSVEAALASLDAAVGSITDTSVLKNVARVADQGLAKTAKQAITDAPSSAVPALLKQFKQATDNVQRDTRPEKPGQTYKEKAVALGEETLNKVKSNLPYVSKTLPARPGILGQPTEIPQKEHQTVANAFINPANMSSYRPTPVTDELSRQRVNPAAPNRQKDEKTGAVEPTSSWRQREAASGQMYNDLVDKLLQTPSYQSASPELQKAALESAREHANKMTTDPRHRLPSPGLLMAQIKQSNIRQRITDKVGGDQEQKRKKAMDKFQPFR